MGLIIVNWANIVCAAVVWWIHTCVVVVVVGSREGIGSQKGIRNVDSRIIREL